MSQRCWSFGISRIQELFKTRDQNGKDSFQGLGCADFFELSNDWDLVSFDFAADVPFNSSKVVALDHLVKIAPVKKECAHIWNQPF